MYFVLTDQMQVCTDTRDHTVLTDVDMLFFLTKYILRITN